MTVIHPPGRPPEFCKFCPECKGASNHHTENIINSCGECDGTGYVMVDCDWCGDNGLPCPECKPSDWAECMKMWSERVTVV